MTKRHGKKGTVGSFREELDDVLVSLKRKSRAQSAKERLEKMKRTRDWASVYSKKSKPTWTPYLWSTHQNLINLQKGYWDYFGFATRVRKVKTKTKGTRYYLDLYNHVARTLR